MATNDSTGAAVADDAVLERDAGELHRSVSALMRVLRCRDRDRICGHDISVTQCHALEVLVERGALTLNELAEALYLEKSTASRVVGGLRRKGHVERSRHPDDGRAVLLEASERGRALQERIEAALVEEQKHTIAGFDPETRREMARLIKRLARAASSRL